MIFCHLYFFATCIHLDLSQSDSFLSHSCELYSNSHLMWQTTLTLLSPSLPFFFFLLFCFKVTQLRVVWTDTVKLLAAPSLTLLNPGMEQVLSPPMLPFCVPRQYADSGIVLIGGHLSSVPLALTRQACKVPVSYEAWDVGSGRSPSPHPRPLCWAWCVSWRCWSIAGVSSPSTWLLSSALIGIASSLE